MEISPPPRQRQRKLRPWCDLLPDLLAKVIARLPFPGDHARFRAVCRGWHAAAALHVRQQLPLLVFQDGSFCTVGGGGDDDDDGGGGGAFFPRTMMPGLPDGVTVVGSADGWLLLDRTDCSYRHNKVFSSSLGRSYKELEPTRVVGVGHAHSYLLFNPFTGATVPLPEVDAIVGNVSEVFEIYRVAIRSSATPADDVIAVVTNSMDCNIILCRPGKGTYVLPYYRVFDVAFVEDWLYGITKEEHLLVFHLTENHNGKPIVTRVKRIIKTVVPMLIPYYWDLDNHEDDDHNYDNNSYSDNGDGDDGDEDANASNNNYNGNGGGGGEDTNALNQGQGVSTYRDDMVMGGKEDFDTEVRYRGDTVTVRMLVKSPNNELLMVRRQIFSPIQTQPYTISVKIFKPNVNMDKWNWDLQDTFTIEEAALFFSQPDVNMGKWISIPQDVLAKDEVALFLSQGSCKSTVVFGDIEAGLIYFDDTNEVFDTRLGTCRPFRLPRPMNPCMWATWIFPPKLVV